MSVVIIGFHCAELLINNVFIHSFIRKKNYYNEILFKLLFVRACVCVWFRGRERSGEGKKGDTRKGCSDAGRHNSMNERLFSHNMVYLKFKMLSTSYNSYTYLPIYSIYPLRAAYIIFQVNINKMNFISISYLYFYECWKKISFLLSLFQNIWISNENRKDKLPLNAFNCL